VSFDPVEDDPRRVVIVHAAEFVHCHTAQPDPALTEDQKGAVGDAR
jgi:hypothetical protein